MIFTGVTGGEIVSLLYPLFILSPFCYIIISKESLDGTSYQYSGNGALQPSKEDGTGNLACRDFFSGSDAAVWDHDRRECFHHAGSNYVFDRHGSQDHRTDL